MIQFKALLHSELSRGFIRKDMTEEVIRYGGCGKDAAKQTMWCYIAEVGGVILAGGLFGIFFGSVGIEKGGKRA